MLNFACTLCSSAMFVSDVLGVGYGQVFCVQCRHAQARACLSTGTPCDRCFSDFGRACARGGGSMVSNDRLNIPAIDTFSH